MQQHTITASVKRFLHTTPPGAWNIICDFDGTITPYDVTDAILETFALPEWKAVEEAWVSGAITARACMARQTELLRAPRQDLDAFLDTVHVDPSFQGFMDFCRERGLAVRIVSDGMDYPIQRVLSRHGLAAVPLVANRLVFQDDGSWRLEFPYGASDCSSGVCKCRVAETGGGATLLIGDGRSDFCLARKADFVLAKEGKDLLRFCEENNLPYAAYQNFSDVRALFASWHAVHEAASRNARHCAETTPSLR